MSEISASLKIKHKPYKSWLHHALANLDIIEGYLIGSAIRSVSPNDIDVFLLIGGSNKNEIERSSLVLESVKEGFADKFVMPLHVTACFEPEKGAFYDFKNKILETSLLVPLKDDK